MRALAPVLVVALFGCGPEDLERWEPLGSTRVQELAHDVGVDFTAGAATLRVTRRFHNPADTHAGLTRHVDVPAGGVIRGFRVTPSGGPALHASLLGADEAAAQWEHLTSPGLAEPAPLARLEWSPGEDGAELELFGLPPGGVVEVAWEVLAPVDYEAGSVSLEVPLEEPTPGFLPPTFPPGLVDEAADPELGVRLARAWVTSEDLDARWGTFPLDTDKTLWRLELDVAPRLSRLPERPTVVFVVDASHSQGPAGLAAQLELVAPYLSHVPDARVEVVLYRRAAERLFGAFVPAPQVAARLAAVSAERLAPGNGSHLDHGARLAAELLAAEPGERRVVLFTDEEVRDALQPARLAEALQALPTDAVVHVVGRTASGSPDELSEARDNAAAFAPIAAAWGGIFTRLHGSAAVPTQAAAVVLELVRPTRLDAVRVEAVGLEEELSVEDVLYEGSSARAAGVGPNPPELVTVTGRLWAREVRRVVHAAPALSERLPAFAIGDGTLRWQLEDDQLRTAAWFAGALSPVTSFLALPPGAAPSVIGVEAYDGIGGLGLHGCSGGCGHTIGCGFGFAKAGIDYAAFLRELLSPAVTACAARHGELAGASLRVESTGDEVVDADATAATPALADCLTEVAWAARLDRRFVGHRRLVLSW